MEFVEATLIKLKTDDGLWEVNDDVPLGKVYMVNPGRVQIIKAFHIPTSKFHKRPMIWCDGGIWFPFEMLKIKEAKHVGT